ncbi:uncharacterized protein LOC131172171 [Hevea brasiliensis]|uniref:uncharacterized protein LOC131172171 n=1 Tax=Hevea brasiliensis TaxID=3981 RepID=UPI0025E72E44|nr:uncharacterized protein LOC131172171 [Hevea brasiliensis]
MRLTMVGSTVILTYFGSGSGSPPVQPENVVPVAGGISEKQEHLRKANNTKIPYKRGGGAWFRLVARQAFVVGNQWLRKRGGGCMQIALILLAFLQGQNDVSDHDIQMALNDENGLNSNLSHDSIEGDEPIIDDEAIAIALQERKKRQLTEKGSMQGLQLDSGKSLSPVNFSTSDNCPTVVLVSRLAESHDLLKMEL